MNIRRRTKRQPSNIFEMLTKSQMSELREAFNLLDTDQDGSVGLNDLLTFSNSIGNPFMPEEIDLMAREADENGEFGKGMSFMIFLTILGEKLAATDDEKVITNAFKAFSDNVRFNNKNTGKFEDSKYTDGLWANKDLLKHYLTTTGDKLTNEEADIFLKGCIENELVDCSKIIGIIKHGEVVTKEP